MSYETRAGYQLCERINLHVSNKVRHHNAGIYVFNEDNTLRCDVTIGVFDGAITIEIYSLQKSNGGSWSCKLLTTLHTTEYRAAKSTIHGVRNSNIDVACSLLSKGSGKERAKFLGY